ncbi:MAG: S8 family serine peptidase, partial [Gemmatimonadota bacterium]
TPTDRSWALDAIGVDSLWARGIKGGGVVVGIIDTGAGATHEQLRGNLRGSTDSWYNPSGRSTVPQDTRTGHGTTMLSVAVGQNLEGKILGVAPEAEWIACAGIPEGRYNNVALNKCADWMLNTGQPDVLINAWLLPGQGCDRSLERIVDAWRAAEILPVFSAGNEGPSAQSDRSPANYVGLYPGYGVALSVGGATRSGDALRASSRGPSSCDGSIYPAVVAPAEDLMAAFPLTPSMYTWAEGTSVAAGLVAGAAGLLLQRYPQASVSDLEEVLRSSALDLGPAGPDNAFGHGQIYLPAALDSLEVLLRRNQSRSVSGDSPATR